MESKKNETHVFKCQRSYSYSLISSTGWAETTDLPDNSGNTNIGSRCSKGVKYGIICQKKVIDNSFRKPLPPPLVTSIYNRRSVRDSVTKFWGQARRAFVGPAHAIVPAKGWHTIRRPACMLVVMKGALFPLYSFPMAVRVPRWGNYSLKGKCKWERVISGEEGRYTGHTSQQELRNICKTKMKCQLFLY